jgi:hypothetical protein
MPGRRVLDMAETCIRGNAGNALPRECPTAEGHSREWTGPGGESGLSLIHINAWQSAARVWIREYMGLYSADEVPVPLIGVLDRQRFVG